MRIKKTTVWISSAILLCGVGFSTAQSLPNIVIIFTDDLGYGDVGCNNALSKVPTPRIDRMASEGMRFTDAHAPATICSPSRFGLLTGALVYRTGTPMAFEGAGSPSYLIAQGFQS